MRVPPTEGPPLAGPQYPKAPVKSDVPLDGLVARMIGIFSLIYLDIKTVLGNIKEYIGGYCQCPKILRKS